ncbi:MAG: molecular chaperone [Gammaproteobacteria bacterium]
MLWLHLAWSHTINISPTKILLSKKKPFSAISLSNPTDDDMVFEVDAEQWSQQNGKDVMHDTADILASPVVFKIPPHKSQVVRVALEKAKDTANEKTYRLLFREVARAEKAPSADSVRVQLEISLPVFVLPREELHTDWRWQSRNLSKHKLQFRFINQGNDVVFIDKMRIYDKKHKAITKESKTFAYVLPGQEHDWVLETLDSNKPEFADVKVNERMMEKHV